MVGGNSTVCQGCINLKNGLTGEGSNYWTSLQEGEESDEYNVTVIYESVTEDHDGYCSGAECTEVIDTLFEKHYPLPKRFENCVVEIPAENKEKKSKDEEERALCHFKGYDSVLGTGDIIKQTIKRSLYDSDALEVPPPVSADKCYGVKPFVYWFYSIDGKKICSRGSGHCGMGTRYTVRDIRVNAVETWDWD